MTAIAQTPASTSTRIDVFKALLRIRMVEEAIAERYADQEMRCPVHLSIGQEAVAVGVCAALRQTDDIVSTHRCHAHYLAKGGNLRNMLAELHGKAGGCCGGRGGSMHLMAPEVGMALSLPVVSSAIPIAAGIALAARQRGDDQVVATFFGDGSVEEGVFHETMNFAALKQLSVIFVLENNLYSVYTHLRDRQPERAFELLGAAHGVPAVRCDGNDVHAVQEAAAGAVAHARAGRGPTLLIADTYRWREHCGPGYDNDIGYRSKAEFEAWRARDPIRRLCNALKEDGLLTAGDVTRLAGEIAGEIGLAFAAAKSAPFPVAATAGDHVYA
jgi:TPP-dependent pyruvate/acetoin dehydrogenase alpha subunit